MPVEGSEEESKGEGASVETVEVERREMAPDGWASMRDGAGEDSMLTAELLESESRLLRRWDAESNGLGSSDASAPSCDSLFWPAGALAFEGLFGDELPKAKELRNQAMVGNTWLRRR